MSVPDGAVPKALAGHKVIKACEACYDDNDDNCSGFVRAVLKTMGCNHALQAIGGSRLANDIVDAFDKPPWKLIPTGGDAAKIAALENVVVIGGLKDTPNGHVVVVVPGALNRGKYPTAYWGSLNRPDKAAKYMTINWAWDPEERDDVLYSYTCLV